MHPIWLRYYSDITSIEDHETCWTRTIPGPVASSSFYKGREVPGVAPHIFLWTHTGRQSQAEVGLSKINYQEAEMAVQLAYYLVECGVPKSSIVILTPYKGQLMLMRKKLLNDASNTWLLYKDPMVKDQIRLSTVDRFQGDEGDVIIASLVTWRCSKHFQAWNVPNTWWPTCPLLVSDHPMGQESVKSLTWSAGTALLNLLISGGFKDFCSSLSCLGRWSQWTKPPVLDVLVNRFAQSPGDSGRLSTSILEHPSWSCRTEWSCCCLAQNLECTFWEAQQQWLWFPRWGLATAIAKNLGTFWRENWPAGDCNFALYVHSYLLPGMTVTNGPRSWSWMDGCTEFGRLSGIDYRL